MAADLDLGSVSAQAGPSATATLNVDAPAGIVAGKLIVVEIEALNWSGTFGMPTGFSQLLAVPESGSIRGYFCGKIATGSEPSSYAFTSTFAPTSWTGRSYLVDDAELSSFPTSAIAGTDSGTSASSPVSVATGITMPTDGLLLGLVVTRVGTATIASSGGVMTPIHAGDAFSGRTARGFYEKPAAGATGSRSWTISGTSTNIAGLLGINPAAGGGTPTYTGDLDAASSAASADFAGTYAPPEYIGALGATSGGAAGEFAGTYAVPEYDGDLAAESSVASVNFSGTYTAPGAAGSLSAASQPASASFVGTYAVPEYAGALGAESGAASTSFSGTYEPPPGGVLSAESGAASAAFSGTYAVPVYDGELAAVAGVADAAFAGSYSVPVYVGALVALSAPATARFTEDPPIVAPYLTGTLTVRPTLSGSLTVTPTLSGTLTLEPS